MKFEIKNRWDGSVVYTCELSAEVAGQAYRFQLGFAVKKAVKERAYLRGAYLSGAYLSGADLSGAYLSGADLSGADLSRAYLSGAVLSDADLSGADLSGADLSGADLSDADLSGADLSGAYLSDADLSRAYLSDADLSGADLSGAGSWIPKIQNIHQSIYNAASKEGALDMRDWHNSCGTTHCRAGWVVTLAGEGGRVMEGLLGTPAAAALIYQASDPTLEKVPNFYCENAEALADMKRLADEEAAKA